MRQRVRVRSAPLVFGIREALAGRPGTGVVERFGRPVTRATAGSSEAAPEYRWSQADREPLARHPSRSTAPWCSARDRTFRHSAAAGRAWPAQVGQAIQELMTWPLRVTQVRWLFADARCIPGDVTFADALYVALAKHPGAVCSSTTAAWPTFRVCRSPAPATDPPGLLSSLPGGASANAATM